MQLILKEMVKKTNTHDPLISDEHMFLFQGDFVGKLQVPIFLQNSFQQDLFKPCNTIFNLVA